MIIGVVLKCGDFIMLRKNNKGQALIEFVLILPIFIFFLFAIIDFGRIVYTKNHLETVATDLVTLMREEKTYDEMVKVANQNSSYPIQLTLDYQDNGYVQIHLNGVVDIITPGLNLIFGNPYKIKVTRVVPYES